MCSIICRWEERQRKGGSGSGGSGGSGRGVRGVDYGLGIGYNPESSNTSSQAVHSRNAAVNSLKTGMMTQFKSSFVSASSNSQSQGFSSSSSLRRPTLSGFVSGGTIGGDINRFQPASSFTTAPTSGLNTSQNSGQNTSQRMSERSLFLAEILRYHSPVFFFFNYHNFYAFYAHTWLSLCSSRDRPRERRRPSGWDR